MIESMTSEQELLRDTTARFLTDTVPLSRMRKELRYSPAGFDDGYWSQGAALGWTMLLVPEDAGGGSVSGQGAVDLSLIAYEFGRNAAPGPLVDCNVVAAALAAETGAIHQDALGRVLTGEAIAACCIGAAPWLSSKGASIRMRRDGSDIIIDGSVKPVESGAQASLLLVTGQCDGGLAQVLVSTDAPGVTVVPLNGLDVTRRFARVDFSGVRVPAEALLGEFGQAASGFRKQLNNAAVILTAESVGAMDAAFNMTVDWAFDRYTFGRALASYQAIKHRFADMRTWLEASHGVADATARAVAENSEEADETASAARSYIGHYGVELAQDCVQLHGGIGVTYEHDLHFYLRRVTIDRLLHGTSAEHRRLLAAIQIEKEQAA